MLFRRTVAPGQRGGQDCKADFVDVKDSATIGNACAAGRSASQHSRTYAVKVQAGSSIGTTSLIVFRGAVFLDQIRRYHGSAGFDRVTASGVALDVSYDLRHRLLAATRLRPMGKWLSGAKETFNQTLACWAGTGYRPRQQLARSPETRWKAQDALGKRCPCGYTHQHRDSMWTRSQPYRHALARDRYGQTDGSSMASCVVTHIALPPRCAGSEAERQSARCKSNHKGRSKW
jgi:hypothetical protein